MGIANEMWKRRVLLSSDYARFTEIGETNYWDMVSHLYEHEIFKNGEQIKPILDYISARLKKSDTVLDVGAGPGTFTLPLASKVRSITAIEPSSKMYALLHNRSKHLGLNNIDWINSTVQDAEITPCDISIAAHSLYYVVDLGSVIQKIYHSTRKRMYIVHGVNNDTLFHELVWEITRREPYIPGPNYRLVCDVLQELAIPYKIFFYTMIQELRFPSIETLFNNSNYAVLEDIVDNFIKKKENEYYVQYNFDTVLIDISK